MWRRNELSVCELRIVNCLNETLCHYFIIFIFFIQFGDSDCVPMTTSWISKPREGEKRSEENESKAVLLNSWFPCNESLNVKEKKKTRLQIENKVIRMCLRRRLLRTYVIIMITFIRLIFSIWIGFVQFIENFVEIDIKFGWYHLMTNWNYLLLDYTCFLARRCFRTSKISEINEFYWEGTAYENLYCSWRNRVLIFYFDLFVSCWNLDAMRVFDMASVVCNFLFFNKIIWTSDSNFHWTSTL